MIKIYSAKQHRSKALADVTSQALETLHKALDKLEATQQPTTVERATLEALEAALAASRNLPPKRSLLN